MKQSAAGVSRAAFVCAASFSVASCVGPPRDVPPLDESRASDIVAIIDVSSFRDYERDECFGYRLENEDGSVEVQCSSPPPFRVRARVVRQLYGPPMHGSISFKTSSHWGTQHLSGKNLKLVHLVTDGSVVLMPDENVVEIGSDAKGKLFVPAYEHEIDWLPCGTDAIKTQVTFKSPADKFAREWQEPVFPSAPEILKQQAIYYVADGERRYPRFGISIDSLSRFLLEKQPGGEAFGCY